MAQLINLSDFKMLAEKSSRLEAGPHARKAKTGNPRHTAWDCRKDCHRMANRDLCPCGENWASNIKTLWSEGLGSATENSIWLWSSALKPFFNATVWYHLHFWHVKCLSCLKSIYKYFASFSTAVPDHCIPNFFFQLLLLESLWKRFFKWPLGGVKEYILSSQAATVATGS